MSGLLDSLDDALGLVDDVIEALLKAIEVTLNILIDGLESFMNGIVISALLPALFGGIGMLAAGLLSLGGYVEDLLSIIDAKSAVSAVENIISAAWDTFLDLFG